MLKSTVVRSPASSSGVFGQAMARTSWKRCTVVRCSRDYSLHRQKSLVEKWVDEMPFIQQIEFKLSDYCTTLEGEKCCSCWEAVFELQDLEKVWPEEAIEQILKVAQYEGIQSVIPYIHHAKLQEELHPIQSRNSKPKLEIPKIEEEPPRHIPEWMPKTMEEIEEEEKVLMAESDFTRLLKSLRIYPKWYKKRRDVEYD